MSIGSLFFSAQGRTGRVAYAAGIGGLLGVALASGLALALVVSVEGPVYEMVTVAISLAMAYPLICLNAKRLHDLGRTGWWQVLVNVFATLVQRLLSAPSMGHDSANLATFMIYLVFYGGLAIAPGQPGRNAFGDPAGRRPLAQAVQVFD